MNKDSVKRRQKAGRMRYLSGSGSPFGFLWQQTAVREMESFDELTEHRGKDATFLIRMKYRQKSVCRKDA